MRQIRPARRLLPRRDRRRPGPRPAPGAERRSTPPWQSTGQQNRYYASHSERSEWLVRRVFFRTCDVVVETTAVWKDHIKERCALRPILQWMRDDGDLIAGLERGLVPSLAAHDV